MLRGLLLPLLVLALAAPLRAETIAFVGTADVSPLVQRLDDQEAAHKKACDQQDVRMDRLQGRIDECEEDRHEIRKECHTLKDKIEDCESHRTELTEQITAQSERIRTLENKTP